MGIDMGIAVVTVGMGAIANKFDSQVSKIMQTRHRPVMKKFDEIAARAKADKALLPTKEYVRPETAMWEIDCPAELPVMTLKDNNTVNILRPEIQGYKKCVSKTDLHHSFPRIFDKFVVKYGEMRIITEENTASYVYPGKRYGEPGYFQVNINTQDGEVYHRFFWKASQRTKIYAGHGKNQVYFFK